MPAFRRRVVSCRPRTHATTRTGATEIAASTFASVQASLKSRLAIGEDPRPSVRGQARSYHCGHGLATMPRIGVAIGVDS